MYPQSITVQLGTKSFTTNISTLRLTTGSAAVFLGARDQLLKSPASQAMRYFEKVAIMAWAKAAQQGGFKS